MSFGDVSCGYFILGLPSLLHSLFHLSLSMDIYRDSYHVDFFYKVGHAIKQIEFKAARANYNKKRISSSRVVVFRRHVGLHRHRGCQRSRQHDHPQHVIKRSHEEGPDPDLSSTGLTLYGSAGDKVNTF